MASLKISLCFSLCLMFIFFFSTTLSSANHKHSHHGHSNHKHSHHGHKNRVVWHTCKESTWHPKYFDLCVNLLENVNETYKQGHDIIPKVFANIALKNISSTHVYVHNLAVKTTRDSRLKETLGECNENYIEAIKATRKAISFLEKKEIKSAVKELKSAVRNVSSCNHEFKKKPDLVSPLIKINKLSYKFVRVALDLTLYAERQDKKN